MFGRKNEWLVLLAGDIICFYAALFVALFLRYQELPSDLTLTVHILPFSMLFGAWLVVFYISGLYEKQTLVLRDRLPGMIFNAQVANSLIAVSFFYLLPFFSIAPKTNLFLTLVFSFILVLYWRNKSDGLFRVRTREDALLIAGGKEFSDLEREVNDNPRDGFRFVRTISLEGLEAADAVKVIRAEIRDRKATSIVADFDNPALAPLMPDFYNLLLANVKLVQMHTIYEGIFDRVPLSILSHSWFLENVSTAPKRVYDFLKRVMDIVVALIFGIITLPFDMLAALAIKLDDGGPIFIRQERVGKNGDIIIIYKFRSMERNDIDLVGATSNRVTRVGKVLRASRVDEFPQLWNVLRGDLSLIGPRPELPSGVALYEKEIPYYSMRHILKPGLSGWAQIYHENHPHHAAAINATKEKLSYDLYYVKNRSLALDLKIALRTVQILFSRSGR